MIVIRVKDQEIIEWWKTITYDRISRNFTRVSVADLILFDLTRHITEVHIHVNLSFSININTTFLIFNLPNKVYVSIGSWTRTFLMYIFLVVVVLFRNLLRVNIHDSLFIVITPWSWGGNSHSKTPWLSHKTEQSVCVSSVSALSALTGNLRDAIFHGLTFHFECNVRYPNVIIFSNKSNGIIVLTIIWMVKKICSLGENFYEYVRVIQTYVKMW